MSNAQPWTAQKFRNEANRYFGGTEAQEFENAKKKYTEAWNARKQDPENAKYLFQEAANLFVKCKMNNLAQIAIEEKNKLQT
ncbi:MAG: hypothetical protein AB1861_28795 [Cyanobacteriota bacterium]